MLRALLLSFLPLAALAGTPPGPECVVLLHGLAREDTSFLLMQETLTLEGYAVVNSDYDSTVAPIEELASTALPEALAACPADAYRVHFVTHSMGGILLRQYVSHHQVPRLGRTVMLAPPNQGSELVDELGELAPFEWLNGPAGGQLSTDGLPARLGPVWRNVGIIAGSRSLNPVYSVILPGADDGKVSVASTKVEGMTAHLTLPVSHTFLMNNPVVIGQVLSFLRTGRFEPGLGLLDVIETLTD
ncbi:alpha/beta fold hydrolase [Jannaschia sp. M317]|nr:alpha/beta fold hydrolase [Jannaschia sp. M317]